MGADVDAPQPLVQRLYALDLLHENSEISFIWTALGALDIVCTIYSKRSFPTTHNKAPGMLIFFVIAMSEFSKISLQNTDSGTFIVTDTIHTTQATMMPIVFEIQTYSDTTKGKMNLVYSGSFHKPRLGPVNDKLGSFGGACQRCIIMPFPPLLQTPANPSLLGLLRTVPVATVD